MLYAFHLIDQPGLAALRLQMRPEHKACLALLQERIAFADPLLQDDDQTMIGSVQIHAFSNLWPQRIGFAP